MDEHLVTFRLGKEEFGVDIMKVQEIIKIPPITLVPRAPEYVEGVINLRGNVIAVLNLKKKFAISQRNSEEESRIIVIQVEDRILGILVDQVTEVLHLPAEDIDPPPPVAVGIESAYIRGLGKIGQRLVVLLQLEKILEHENIERKVS